MNGQRREQRHEAEENDFDVDHLELFC